MRKLLITLIWLCAIVFCVTVLPFYLGVFTKYVFNLEYEGDGFIFWGIGFMEIILSITLIGIGIKIYEEINL